MDNKFDFYDMTNLKSYNLNESMRYQLNMLSNLDVFTLKHCENVASITCRICKYFRLNKDFTIYCTVCAYLHDIGKQFIPSSILQKNGLLTDEEYEKIKTHTTIGYKICMQDLKLRPYINGPLMHHESLDGSGYPNGLTMENIPLEAQIIKVADEYDAIVSKRQYKSHIDISETLQILAGETNPNSNNKQTKKPEYSILNPQIVHALFNVVKDDITYEIKCSKKYFKYLKEQIKRLSEANEYINEYKTLTKEKDKKSYEKMIRYYLQPR